MDGLGEVDDLSRLPGGGDRRQGLDRGRGIHTQQNGGLRGAVRVAHGDLHEEAVELCLGQRIGAVHVDRVLRGDDHERPGDGVGPSVHGDPPLLHHLQQCRLGLGRGAVDLVAVHEVAEDRTPVELELVDRLVVDGDPCDVRGQQVRGELDALQTPVDGGRQTPRQHGLADAGHVLDEQVALGYQADDGELDDLALPADDRLDVVDEPLAPLGDVRGGERRQWGVRVRRRVLRVGHGVLPGARVPVGPCADRCSSPARPYGFRAPVRQVTEPGHGGSPSVPDWSNHRELPNP
jgi:hypothetical protein